jgi:hypothetical protein
MSIDVRVNATHDSPRTNCGSPLANVNADAGHPSSDPNSSVHANTTSARFTPASVGTAAALRPGTGSAQHVVAVPA